MGFTIILLMVCLALFIIDVISLKKKNRILFISITIIMVLGIVTLGYLWLKSPM